MAVLTILLAAPIQSWGDAFNAIRPPAGDKPTRAALLGLIANAMGVDRAEYDQWAMGMDMLHMTVIPARAYLPGEDYHTITRRKGMIVRRDGLQQDGAWWTILEADRPLLERVREALFTPARPLYLGRRSQTPGLPIVADHAEYMGHDYGIVEDTDTTRMIGRLTARMTDAPVADASDDPYMSLLDDGGDE